MELISLAIFTASLLCILLRPWGMPEWVAALAGSAAMLSR
jgi:Na+/H+ antiporter NhaD/arsenite permease-like protein